MEKIEPKSCKRLNAELSQRIMAFFQIFRENFPKQVQYHFGILPNDDVPEGDDEDIVTPVSDNQLSEVFEREEDIKENIPPKLQFLRQVAQDMAEKTYTDGDCSIEQLTKNLISLIGQKSVEMHMLANLASMNSDEIRAHYTKICTEDDGAVELDRIDIVEAAEVIRRSRTILLAFKEAQEFENNFIKHKAKIPKTYFHRKAVQISNKKKAMI